MAKEIVDAKKGDPKAARSRALMLVWVVKPTPMAKPIKIDKIRSQLSFKL
ncbi:hypothetical protein ACFQ5M_07775 [Agrilactobacillus yilanensis]|uniref:Uncharacterized protein n=1 Tax=Agrilactobacillus yilanensis TaxID=2485997 RepID=A0ABW4J7N8_9LACO|nr:hypothetical protein [Agrilactobacillus yilanensis]